ncbi:MAG: DUF393 domain-containing protein [Phycisphaerae bacterium]|nr:DUF393 domain-containing protein [Phycisphaerae bacterium]
MTSSFLVLFDGHCNLCNSVVVWIIRHDARGLFRFAALQSSAGSKALADAGVREPIPESVVLFVPGSVRPRLRSDAAIGIARGLGFPWSLAAAALLIPRPIRDRLYNAFAERRNRWFGSRESCMAPTPAIRDRFLDADEWSSIGKTR